MNNLWNTVAAGMLAYLNRPLRQVSQYIAEPDAVFQLVAKAENVDLYNDFTGILVVDGLQKALRKQGDEKDKDSDFYQLLSQIASLSLMSRHSSETKNGTLRKSTTRLNLCHCHLLWACRWIFARHSPQARISASQSDTTIDLEERQFASLRQLSCHPSSRGRCWWACTSNGAYRRRAS